MIFAVITHDGIDFTGLAALVAALTGMITAVGGFFIKKQGKTNQRIGETTQEAILHTQSQVAVTKKLAEENKDAVQDVRQKVNGNLEKAVAQAKEEARRQSGPRVLLIDDDENDLHLAMAPLDAFNCTVFVARSAEEAEVILLENIGSARGFPFDFALVDLRMPGGGSEKVLAMFKKRAPRIGRQQRLSIFLIACVNRLM